MDKRPLPPGPKRTPSSDSFEAVIPHERETILKQMQQMEMRIRGAFDEFKERTDGRLGETDKRLLDVERFIVEVRSERVEAERTRAAVDRMNDKIDKFIQASYSNDISAERMMGQLNARVVEVASRTAREAASAEGEVSSLVALSKASKNSKLVSFVVSVIIGLIAWGANKMTESKPEGPPPPTYPRR